MPILQEHKSVHTALKQMGRVTVAKGMTGDAFIDLQFTRQIAHTLLYSRFINMVATDYI